MWQAEVYVTFKPGVLDPQGEATRGALLQLGYDSVTSVRVGKYILLELAAPGEAEARAAVGEMCRRLLANPVIEDYRIELAPGREGPVER